MFNMSSSDMWFWTIIGGCAVIGFLVGFFDNRGNWTRDARGRRQYRAYIPSNKPDSTVIATQVQQMTDMQKQLYIQGLHKNLKQ
jgi:hypothetical protein